MTADYDLSDDDLLTRCTVRRGGASGPGGQHANRHATGVTLTHNPTGIVSQHHVHRDSRRNLKEALFRLRLRLALELRGQSNLDWLARFRGPEGRLKVSPNNAQYPRVIACCLDALAVADYAMHPAAETLGCTISQMAKCFAGDKEAWTFLNQQLTAHGHSTLRHS